MSAATIVFDGAVLAAGPPTGVARAFLTALVAYAARGDARCVLLLPHGAPLPDDPAATALVQRVPPRTLRGAGRSWYLPRLLRDLDAALLHSPVAAIPLRAPCPIVATVHDVPWLVRPPLREHGCGRRHRLALHLALRRAAAVIVPSQSTARAVQQVAPSRARARVVVIPHGLPPPSAAAPLDARDGPLLAFADARPRKNLAALRRADALARRRWPALPPLRVLGPGLDWVDEDTKHALLRRACALIAPSLHEGFGLPLLEAFGHGLPVACAARASLPELAGDDAALFFDPGDDAAIAAAMIDVARDVPLRTRLAAHGRQRALALSAAATAEAWSALHHRLFR